MPGTRSRRSLRRGERMIANVVGPRLRIGRHLRPRRDIDRVEAGDLLMIRTCGAYAATMARTYNSRPLIAEVLVNGGDWAVVRERQEIDALMQAERMPPWLGR